MIFRYEMWDHTNMTGKQKGDHMNQSMIAQNIRANGLRATAQRILIYQYLFEHRTHPDAEEVYRAMCADGQKMTLATVYNVLQAFVEHGLAITVRADEERVRFDATTTLHGHFICSRCKRIYDFPITQLQTEKLDDFSVNWKDICFGGICKQCRENAE